MINMEDKIEVFMLTISIVLYKTNLSQLNTVIDCVLKSKCVDNYPNE